MSVKRPNSDVLSFDELLKGKDKYRDIFTKETLDYIESLLNLEVSVFKPEISEENKKALMELRYFRNLVFYNLYHRAQKLYDNESENYQFVDLFRAAEIQYKNDEILPSDIPLQLFHLQQDLQGYSSIILYNPTDKSLEELTEILELQKKELKILLERSFINHQLDTYDNWEIKKKIERLNQLSEEDIKKVSDDLHKKNVIQRGITSLAMQDYGFDLKRDFDESKKGLENNTAVANVLVKRKDARPIFK